MYIFDYFSNRLVDVTVFSVCPAPVEKISREIFLVNTVPPKWSWCLLLFEYISLGWFSFPIKIFLCYLKKEVLNTKLKWKFGIPGKYFSKYINYLIFYNIYSFVWNDIGNITFVAISVNLSPGPLNCFTSCSIQHSKLNSR